MVDVYLISIKEKENSGFSERNVSFLPLIVKEKILNTKDNSTRLERVYAYSLLRYVLNGYGVSDEKFLKKFSFDEKGKPHLVGSDFEFSLSHTDGMAAVAVYKNGMVGVDIEKIDNSKKEKLEKITARFYKGSSSFETQSGLMKIYTVDFCKKINENVEAKTESPSADDMPFTKWTVLESALKQIGDGFECIGEVERITKELKTESTVISFGEMRYALSVAISK